MQNYESLLTLMSELPPDLSKIEDELKKSTYTSEAVTAAACEFVDNGTRDYTDYIDDHGYAPKDEEINSTYIYDICKLLLGYGLDPNMILGEEYDQKNIMYGLYWQTKPYVAADTLRLLIEHGADPHLEFEYESIYNISDRGICFDITEGYANDPDYSIKFDCRFHFWLVLLATVSDDEKDKKYIQHEKYDHVITRRDDSTWDIGVTLKSTTTTDEHT